MLPWRSLAAVSVLSCWKVSISYQLLMLAALRANWDMWERKPLGASSSSTNTLANSRTSQELDRSLQICHYHLGNERRSYKLALQGNCDKWESQTTVEINWALKIEHVYEGGRKKRLIIFTLVSTIGVGSFTSKLWLVGEKTFVNEFKFDHQTCLPKPLRKWTEHTKFATSTWRMNQWQIFFFWNW